MQDAPLRRIAQNFRRLNSLLFGILPLILIMGSVLFAGFQRVINQEQERIAVDFSLLTLYLAEQETFLKRLDHNRILEFSKETDQSTQVFRVMDQQLAQNATVFRSSTSLEDTPFSLICESISSCPLDNVGAAHLGRYLADIYSSFWVQSGYPASTLMLVNTDKGTTYTVPLLGSVNPRMPASLVMAAIATIRANAPVDDEIRWTGLTNFPDYMITYTLIHNPDLENSADNTYAATLTYRNRINIFSTPLKRRFYDEYWLESLHNGLLLGDRPLPDVADEVSYRTEGLVFKIDDDSKKWTAYYMLSYKNLLRGHYWLLIGIITILILSPVAGWFYVRWYQRRVIAPAQQAHRQVVESDEFSRILLETSPIALCVLSCEKRLIIFANSLALKWFDIQVGGRLQDSTLHASLLEQILEAKESGAVECYQSPNGNSFYIAFTPTRYRNQDVVISAFVDLSVRTRLEQELTQAKLTADKASSAKSVFLATMSHEIRTPLYGVLGSLELMGLTNLDYEQKQLLDRIQISSELLLQIISDILDITKIESDQLVLGEQVFDPRMLIQSCIAAHIAMAQKKDLLLFSSIDPALPAALMGDTGRIRQILTNLISNAIKFTYSGHIIVRARVEPGLSGHVLLTLQVSDTGVGIGKDEQKALFTPFHQVDADSHTIQGAGLGLSISARLAKLMGSEIRLTSEKGLGSSFSLQFALPIASEHHTTPQPVLNGARVFVCSAHHELTDNLCQWLNKWGAQASKFDETAPDTESAGILVSLFEGSASVPLRAVHGLTKISLGGTYGRLNENFVDVCDYAAIGFAIENTLHGESIIGRIKPAPNLLSNHLLPPLHLNVLVAEDNEINQATLGYQLKQLGCQSTLAADGAEALDLWKIGNYDVLLTDVNMPRMNGYELAGKLRAQQDDRPIIGITANAMSDEEDRCKAAGMDACLVKPVQLRTLWDSLAQLSSFDVENDKETLKGLPQPRQDPDSLPRDLRDIFISTMSMDLVKLKAAIHEKQYDLIFSLLHRIRGSLAVAGYESLIQQLEAFGDSLRAAGLTDDIYMQSIELLLVLEQVSQSDSTFLV